MRMPPARSTVRWLLAAVALAGMGAWGARLRRASDAYRARAARLEADYFRLGSICHSDNPTLPEAEQARRRARYEARMQRAAAYLLEMRAKYDRAARHPWLPVEPDPPEPE